MIEAVRSRRSEASALAIAVASGLAIAWMDSRPGFDATGITVVALFVAAAVAASVGRRQPWLWALLVGGWVPLLEVPISGSAAPFAALIVAGAGAAAGYIWVQILARR